MKKVILIPMCLLSIAAIATVYILNGQTTPKSRLKQQFNIDLTDQEVAISNEKEKWYPNGDGFYYVEITIAEGEDITKTLISNSFKPLPIIEDIPENEIPAYAKVIQDGYYKFGNMDSDPRNFKIAIYDVKAKKIIFYYQLM